MNSTEMIALGKELKEALAPLAEKIGQGAGHVYALAVREAFITGVASGIYCVLSLVVFITCMVVITKTWKKHLLAVAEKEKQDWNNGEQILCTALGSCFGLIALILFFANINTVIHYLSNPEYAALRDLVKMVAK